MVERIRANWNSQADAPAVVFIKFTIQRDGTITDAHIEKPSPYEILNLTALRAVVAAKQLPGLPAQFPNPTLGVSLRFEYQR
jgi:TonB family protein